MDNSGTEVFYIVLLGFVLMLLMGSFMVTMVIVHRQKQLQNQQKLAAVRAEYEKTIINAEKEIRENTLTNVGRELHDNIGQLLSLAKMNLASSKPEKVSEGKSMLNQIIKEVRTLSKSLNLDWVESITLENFIQNELEKLESAGFCKTVFDKNGEEVQLDKDKKIILIRTIQECLNNAIKHANPQAISFHMATNKDQFVIYMRDDGVGFDTSEDSSGSGMYNLKNRMTAIGGVFEIESEPGNGTEIKLSLPISNP
ncbi:ATP-binding protein [Cecembia sp.]|uniref:sensor histidine kinase n=1 Tax=Cecembia sp. TaxID=1898110 RepID=UPI0025BB89BC|nr:ATP-binding protein [Cecembia sp.]